MFSLFLNKIKATLKDKGLRRRVFFVILILAVFRLAAAIVIPGVDRVALEQFFSDNQFFGLLNIFSGGGLSNLSIMMLGVGPFITASIIMQLATMIFPSLKELYHEEGDAGRRKMNQYSRILTVPLALAQGFGLLVLLQQQGVLLNLSLFDKLTSLIIVATGSVLLMWLGELINEYGIGNGVSLLIFSGIVAGIPSAISNLYINFEPALLPVYLGFLVSAVLIIAGVVFVTEAERPIPITYAKRMRGNKIYGGMSTYLPIRLNNAGVMPIIFALSLLLFPQMIVNFLAQVNNDIIQTVSTTLLELINNTWLYSGVYFILIFGFTYFYSAITFDPESIATNLQKSGAFIPGVRPGNHTAEFIGKVVGRLTLIGALFLGIIAMLPLLMQGLTGISSLAIGGTGLLIVVSVALDFMKQVDAQLSMREY